MRVVAVNQFYAPDHAATSQLLTELCEDLVSEGDEITVIASRGGYLGGAPPLPPKETRRGVRVVRPLSTRFGKATLSGRLADYATFWVTSALAAAVAARPDVLLVLTTPPMIAAGGALVARARRLPLVTWVQDVYPDAAVALGVLPPRGPSLSRAALLAMARATHHAAARIIALSDGMADRLEKQGAPRDRIRVLPNWADGRAIRPMPREGHPFRRAHGLEGRFVAMYSGNLGKGHDVATFIAAARRLAREAPEILFLFIGDGARKPEAQALAQGLDNVRFLPYQPHDTLGESLSAADVHLISLREDLAGLLVPSKLYGALAAGRPIIYVGPPSCEVARVVREHDLGWAGRPGDQEGVSRALLAAIRNPDIWEARGRRARQIFCARYDRLISSRRFRELLREVSCEPLNRYAWPHNQRSR
jgi:putative colanic acid biosynthesis glycosyltransferase WcaI